MKNTKRPMPTAMRASHPAVEEKHVMDYVRVLYKRRWILLPVFLIMFTVGSVNALRQTPIYQGRAQLLIDLDAPKVAKLDQMFESNGGYFSDEFYQTQYRILQSRSTAKLAVDALNLWNAPRLGSGPDPRGSLTLMGLVSSVLATVTDLVKKPFTAESTPPAAARPGAVQAEAQGETARQSARIDEFLGGLQIVPVRNSRLVEVRYSSTDPVFAATAANAVTKAFIQQNMQSKFTTSKDAADFLGDRLAEQRRALEASEAALQAYKERNGTVSVADSASNIVVQRLTDLNAALTKAKTERINKEAAYNQLKSAEGSGALDTFPAVIANDYIQKLKADLSDLQRQQATLSQRYNDRHPEMIKVHSSIEAADAKLKAELSKVVQSVKNEYQAALSEEQSLQSALNAQKGEALSLNRKGIEYGVLQREAESNKQIYESLLQRTKETGISSELRASNVRVVDPAEVPRAPVSPNIQRDVMMAFGGSLVLAIALAFFLEHLDNHIRTPQELKAHLGIPFLGMVPTTKPPSGSINPLVNGGAAPNFVEALKTVRTNLLFSTAEEGLKCVVVTSAGPSEGKSLIAANLALALAQAGQRVLLVDADMRRPRVHEIFDIQQEPGLSNVLTGHSKLTETIHKSPTHGLWLLASGHIPPNPAELLGSPRYADFVAALDDHFDWAIIDTPPVMAVTDSTVAANEASGVVFVVGADKTNRHAARTAVEQLDAAGAHLLGAVLNNVDIARHPHYYPAYYRKEYAKYYVSSTN